MLHTPRLEKSHKNNSFNILCINKLFILVRIVILIRMVNTCLFQFQKEPNFNLKVACTGIIILVKETEQICPIPLCLLHNDVDFFSLLEPCSFLAWQLRQKGSTTEIGLSMQSSPTGSKCSEELSWTEVGPAAGPDPAQNPISDRHRREGLACIYLIRHGICAVWGERGESVKRSTVVMEGEVKGEERGGSIPSSCITVGRERKWHCLEVSTKEEWLIAWIPWFLIMIFQKFKWNDVLTFYLYIM